MPTVPPGTLVAIRPDTLRRLTFPPPAGADLLIAVHPGALKAPQSPHTQLVGFERGDLCWAGALSEHRLGILADASGDPRQLLGEAMGVGPRLWDVIWPGELIKGPGLGPRSTIYQGERPWVVVGEAPGGDLLAAPLNDAANPKWYTPLLTREEVLMTGSTKDAQLELAHVWAFPAFQTSVGTVAEAARPRVLGAIREYF